MGERIVITCDGCDEEISRTESTLKVACHQWFEVGGAQEPGYDRTLVQGAVIDLDFCTPECATKWFKAHEEDGFNMQQPQPPIADPGAVPEEIVEAYARAMADHELRGMPVPHALATLHSAAEAGKLPDLEQKLDVARRTTRREDVESRQQRPREDHEER